MLFTIDKAISLASPGPMQSVRELEFLYKLCEELQPKKILEIGTGCGATTMLLAMSGAKVVTLDIFVNPTQFWQHKINEGKIPARKLNIVSLERDSQLQETADEIRDDYDILFIDGAHEFDKGGRDYELYGPMAKVVALHDIVGYEQPDIHAEDFNSWPTRFWWGIKSGGQYKTREITDLPAGSWGVLFK